ncbi:MAG: hypothetical protein HY680_03695 [Chloroflexi bacterium]|nr:hypothetical protein [Chloroflexota bacterium]
MTGQSLIPGTRVRVINPRSVEHGRIGKVSAEAPVTADGQRQWQVVFEWPLGGIEARATLREEEMEVIG